MKRFLLLPRHLPILLLAAVLVICSLSPYLSGEGGLVYAAERKKPLHIEADKISYDKPGDALRATGRVRMTFADLVLEAEEVVFNAATNRAVAVGGVVLTSAEDRLEGERLEVDTATGTGALHYGRVFMARNNFFLHARRIEKTGRDTYRAFEARVTTCDGDNPDWQITGEELEVTIDGYGRLWHGKFLVRNIPVLYVPFLIFPAKTTRQSGFLLPRVSQSRDIHGWDVELPFFLALSENMDATFFLRYLEKSGLKLGLEHRYFLGEASSGTFYGSFLRDRRAVSDTVAGINRNWPDGAERWALYWHHETILSESAHLRLDLHRVSDIWYFRDFSAANYFLDHRERPQDDRFRRVTFTGDESLTALTSTARFNWRDDWHHLNFLLRHTDNLTSPTNEATLQKYPEISFGGARRQFLGGPLQYEWGGAVSYNHRETGPKGYLAELNPALFLPLNIGGIATITPSAAVRGTYWNRSDDPAGIAPRNGDRLASSLGLHLATEVHRIFPVGASRVEKIKHTVRPEITYSYVAVTQEADHPDFVAAVSRANIVTYALTNSFTARASDKEGRAYYWDYLRLRISQTYNLREAERHVAPGGAPRRPFGDLLFELDANPWPGLSFTARNSFDVYAGRWRQTNYDFALNNRRGDRLNLGYRLTRDLLEEADLALQGSLTRELFLLYRHRLDLRDGRDLERTLGLTYRRQCWAVEFTYSVKDLDTRLMLNINLIGLGRFGG